jgi:hypothetical protein
MSTTSDPRRLIDDTDLLVVGAGAAGLTAAIAAAEVGGIRVRLLDGARQVGAKILVSGGSRCNVTNAQVSERDFNGGSPRAIRRVLQAFPVAQTIAWFEALGVPLHEEAHGKLFPDSNRARTVVDALLRALHTAGGRLECGQRVVGIRRHADGFLVETGTEVYAARRIVLATGGRSLPKTGSDGFGYELAARLGHGYVATTPALVPLVLAGDRHVALTGVAHDVALSCASRGRDRIRIGGALLWTHFGASGPAVLDVSRHWLRGRLEGHDPSLTLSLLPDHDVSTLEAFLLAQRQQRPRAQVKTVLAGLLPAAVAERWCAEAGLGPDISMSHLTRDARRALVARLLDTALEVIDSRGYTYAEVTAGGVPLDEIDPATMESRICPGVHLVGEILDVDGRLGGFNFQWAWASGSVAGRAAAQRLRASRQTESRPG